MKEIIKKEENEKIIKPEINISIDNKESPTSEKIIPEINISIDNKEAPNQNEKNGDNQKLKKDDKKIDKVKCCLDKKKNNNTNI